MIYIHLGLHKTGTTSLQNSVFPYLEHVEFIGRGEDENELFKKISKVVFSKEFYESDYQPIIDEINAINRDILISDEWFTSEYSGLYGFNGCSWREKVRRLSILFSNVETKVFVTIRYPHEIVPSTYAEFIPRGIKHYYSNLKEYVDHSEDGQTYDFEELVKYLEEMFVSVEVFTFESIIEDKAKLLCLELFDESEIKNMEHNNKRTKSDSYVIVEKQRTYINKTINLISKISVFIPFKRTRLMLNFKKKILSLRNEKTLVNKPTPSDIDYIREKYRKSYDFYHSVRDCELNKRNVRN
ncbi:hypothetical protein NB600_02235 [Vibrio antiquarius]|uniref:hypothetical protein n=1 Tax=Vibrio antiquarius (strain Ex25) TaxID=150340 RepID=UPI00265D11B8|nr:hypothetical protein [Vibrio antiquarius]MCR9684642.1 hypothetical protein [Vibrio antiquarius]